MSHHHYCKYSNLTVCLFTLCIVINTHDSFNVFVCQISKEMFLELKNINHNNYDYYYYYCYY